MSFLPSEVCSYTASMLATINDAYKVSTYMSLVIKLMAGVISHYTCDDASPATNSSTISI